MEVRREWERERWEKIEGKKGRWGGRWMEVEVVGGSECRALAPAEWSPLAFVRQLYAEKGAAREKTIGLGGLSARISGSLGRSNETQSNPIRSK